MRIIQHKNDGVYLEFCNGLKLSTIWGYCTYSDNHDVGSGETGFEPHENGSTTVEFMFRGGDEKLIKKLCKRFGNGHNPSAYVPVEKWLEMLAYITNLCKKGKL